LRAPADFRQALERGDDLVQTLTIAKYALCLGDVERAMAALDTALASSREAITEMTEVLGTRSILATSLVRSAPALTSEALVERPPRTHRSFRLTS
jgi:hypothetical protein